MDERCRWCGRQGGTEKHHLYRRSLQPKLIDDPKNIVNLCFRCHRRATEQRSFEEKLQKAFYLNK